MLNTTTGSAEAGEVSVKVVEGEPAIEAVMSNEVAMVSPESVTVR